MGNPVTDEFVSLIRSFLDCQIEAGAFEREYLSRFKSEEREIGSPDFFVLDELFAEVDAYCEDDALRDADDLDEAGLREACLRALKKLGRDT